ncbi:MAG: dipeptide epimerase [Synergistaceae bacterium]|jgi:L-alanine-DL-glutamate epimerase-like enolase superfamily enzyme|nr:dipeptide epimerase [Synergistaceae bacterium]
MKITGIRLGKLSIPLKKPFKTALRTTSTVPANIIEIRTDEGVCGYGEAPPTAAITGDTDGAIRDAVGTRIAPALIGRDVSELADSLDIVERSLIGNTSGKAAADIALHDLWGKLYGLPLYKLLGGTKREFATDYTISLNSPEEMAGDAREAVSEGYEALKIKVGNDFRTDMERMRTIRDAVGGAILLRADANQGWTPKEAIRAIKFMEEEGLDVELVEQPVASHDIEGLKKVTDAVDTIILADEAVYSPRDAMKILSLRAADMINIKLMKSGGIGGALKICAMAEACGVECMIGAMMESKVSVTAAAHLSMARRVITKYDLDPPILCASDPVKGGVTYKGALLTLSDAPGLGIESIEGVEWEESR